MKEQNDKLIASKDKQIKSLEDEIKLVKKENKVVAPIQLIAKDNSEADMFNKEIESLKSKNKELVLKLSEIEQNSSN